MAEPDQDDDDGRENWRQLPGELSSFIPDEGKAIAEDGDHDGGSGKRDKARKSGKRVREGGKEGEGNQVKDPLKLLGPDILSRILRRLDAPSVARSLIVSRGWHTVASRDLLWGLLLDHLWLGKAHIPRVSSKEITKLAAYSFSVMDATRSRITKEDLCSHVWIFRFKKTASDYWRNLDPAWEGTGPPLRRYFHLDGSVTADPEDKVWGGHECTYSIVTSFLDGDQIREHYVRINRWPRMSVSRKPDWSWKMANQMCCYYSIPDADEEGGTGRLSPQW